MRYGLLRCLDIYQWLRQGQLPCCRFFPTCSQYARSILKTEPLLRATIKISWRLMRCHPYHPGGVDLP